MPTAATLQMREIRKTYPGVVAVDSVDFDLFAGEIHALVGENGAGKSTLSAIAFGEIRADRGTVTANGAVGLVHQHFELAGRLRVWQNVLLGREPKRGWRIDAAAARARVHDLAARNGMDIDVDAFVDDLPVGVQQRVELLRELDRNPAVLLLDEPTAALAPAEISAFFESITQLAQRGTAIMIVTHKLQEVLAYAARVTVMRHGRMVASMPAREASIERIAREMVGGDLPHVAQRAQVERQPYLSVRAMSAGSDSSRVHDLSFNVASGEIVGIAGVEGNGQTPLADALAGMIAHTGDITTADESGERPRVIPQDRQHEALVMPWTLVDNAVLGRQRLPGIRRGAAIDRSRARADAAWIAQHFDVRTTSLDVPVRTLSGGNQQKLVVGRALIDEPRLIIAYNPTRGIDVGAAALVQSRLIQARNRGAAVLLISFDLDEILTLADRVLVLYRGTFAGSFTREAFDRAAIGRMMAGA